MPTATTVNPRDPQTSIFHLTVPPRPPGSEVPLSPAQLHRGHPGPQPPTQNQGCPSPWQPLGSAVAPGAAWQGTRQSPGCFSRAPLAFRMLSPGPCPQSGAPNRAALPSLRSLQAVGTQEITAELGLCSGPRSTRASPAHPGPPGPHPRGPWSTQASPTRPGLPRPYPLALVHPGLTHMGPGLPGPHPLTLSTWASPTHPVHLGLTHSPWSSRASPTRPGPPGPHPLTLSTRASPTWALVYPGLTHSPWSTRASPTWALVHPGLTHMGPGPPGPHPHGAWSTWALPPHPGLPGPHPLALVHTSAGLAACVSRDAAGGSQVVWGPRLSESCSQPAHSSLSVLLREPTGGLAQASPSSPDVYPGGLVLDGQELPVLVRPESGCRRW